ncbi:MAG: hypothetical protein Q9163_005905 [Psora crenata]
MGQEQSSCIDASVTPRTLKDRSIESVAEFMRDGRDKKVVVMVGAGISTSAGIPDFRSPNTGLYENLARLRLPFPEAVFDISYFRSNPLPFYTLAHELYPGKYRPTIAHTFIRLLADKGLLFKLFTQNIDCLERGAGVPADKIIEAHGSFARQRCIECRCPYSSEKMREAINDRKVPHCEKSQCNGLVKPDIVFFGEPLPAEFHQAQFLPRQADLCIIMGTSLSVHPFASLPGFCAEGVPRVLINLERVGGLGSRADDVLILGDCDEGVQKLAGALGWCEELDRIWNNTKPNMGATVRIGEQDRKPSDVDLDEQVSKLTESVDRSLRISNGHADMLREHLKEKHKVWMSAEIQRAGVDDQDLHAKAASSSVD